MRREIIVLSSGVASGRGCDCAKTSQPVDGILGAFKDWEEQGVNDGAAKDRDAEAVVSGARQECLNAEFVHLFQRFIVKEPLLILCLHDVDWIDLRELCQQIWSLVAQGLREGEAGAYKNPRSHATHSSGNHASGSVGRVFALGIGKDLLDGLVNREVDCRAQRVTS